MEHYVERYIPIQIQNMIITNMQTVLDDKDIQKLKSEEN